MHSAGAMAAPGPGWGVRGPTGQSDGPRSGVQPAPFLIALGDAVGPSREAQGASAPPASVHRSLFKGSEWDGLKGKRWQLAQH